MKSTVETNLLTQTFVSSQAVPLIAAQRIPTAVVRGERNASVKMLRLRLASIKSIQRITKVRHAICKKNLQLPLATILKTCVHVMRRFCLNMVAAQMTRLAKWNFLHRYAVDPESTHTFPHTCNLFPTFTNIRG